MTWTVIFYPDFETEFDKLSITVQDEILAHAKLLERFGPQLGRPHIDTLYDSKHSNMKEMRFSSNKGVWRIAFAFDIQRKAVLLVAGDKSGISQKHFYKTLIRKADERFTSHLCSLKKK